MSQSQFPMPDPEFIRKEMVRQVAGIELRLLYLEAMRTGVSQQGVAKQKLLEWQINGLEYESSMPQPDPVEYLVFVQRDPTERVSRQDLLKQERYGTGLECKARCDLLTLDIVELRLQLQGIKEQLDEMDKRVIIPNSGSMM